MYRSIWPMHADNLVFRLTAPAGRNGTVGVRHAGGIGRIAGDRVVSCPIGLDDGREREGMREHTTKGACDA